MGREEKAYVMKMPPYPFIQVYPFIRDLRVETWSEDSLVDQKDG